MLQNRLFVAVASEMSWDKVRRAQMRWSVECEECSVKCGAWRVQCEVWSAKCGVWRKQWEVRSVDCEVRSVKCGVLRAQCKVKCGVRRVQCEGWRVECEVWSVKSAVRSVQCEAELQMWHLKQFTTFAECTHARAWLAHGTCKHYRWEKSCISLRQLPPRLVRVLPVWYDLDVAMSIMSDIYIDIYMMYMKIWCIWYIYI